MIIETKEILRQSYNNYAHEREINASLDKLT